MLKELRASGVLQRVRLQNVQEGAWRVAVRFVDSGYGPLAECGFVLRSEEKRECLVYNLNVRVEWKRLCEHIFFDMRYKNNSVDGGRERWEYFRPYDDYLCRAKGAYSSFFSALHSHY